MVSDVAMGTPMVVVNPERTSLRSGLTCDGLSVRVIERDGDYHVQFQSADGTWVSDTVTDSIAIAHEEFDLFLRF